MTDMTDFKLLNSRGAIHKIRENNINNRGSVLFNSLPVYSTSIEHTEELFRYLQDAKGVGLRTVATNNLTDHRSMVSVCFQDELLGLSMSPNISVRSATRS